jgi:hypothetical protein
MVEQKGFELAAPMIGYARGIVPDFGAVSALQKSTNTVENLIAGNSPLILNLAARSVLFWDPGRSRHTCADFGATGLASEPKESNVCGCPRGRVDSP